jgi:phage baseplate assembly protein W
MAKYLGIILPQGANSNVFFAATTSVSEQLKTNLTNLLLTKKGERLMLPTFGCDIHNLLFEHINDNLVADVDAAVKTAVGTWMPFLEVLKLEVTKETDTNDIVIKVSFRLLTNANITDSITLVL